MSHRMILLNSLGFEVGEILSNFRVPLKLSVCNKMTIRRLRILLNSQIWAWRSFGLVKLGIYNEMAVGILEFCSTLRFGLGEIPSNFRVPLKLSVCNKMTIRRLRILLNSQIWAWRSFGLVKLGIYNEMAIGILEFCSTLRFGLGEILSNFRVPLRLSVCNKMTLRCLRILLNSQIWVW
ncbi:hypothetical protein QLX08_003367 [Tetragonisca angustula]|uniref:Uncharacterized protein n=1 Tax=Tetragonisca angustula TaxID=166442 RepID=A0AAW1A8V0_9HYME